MLTLCCQYEAYFCSDSMLEPLKRYDINPKTRSSCNPRAIVDAFPAQSIWTNPERHRSSSAPAHPTYFSTSTPTVRNDLLNVQVDRLAASWWNVRLSYHGRPDQKRLDLLAWYHHCLSRTARQNRLENKEAPSRSFHQTVLSWPHVAPSCLQILPTMLQHLQTCHFFRSETLNAKTTQKAWCFDSAKIKFRNREGHETP